MKSHHFLDPNALSLKDELENSEINKIIDYIKPLMNSATDRNTINKDNYTFYFKKLITSRGIKIQNDLLTNEKIATNWAKYIGGTSGGLSALFMIYKFINCIRPDTTVRTVAQGIAHASHMINRTGTLLNYAWGRDGSPPSYQEYE